MTPTLIRLFFHLVWMEAPNSPQTLLGKILYRSGYTPERLKMEKEILMRGSLSPREEWRTEDPIKELAALSASLIEKGNRDPFEVFVAEPLIRYASRAPGYSLQFLEEVYSIVARMNLPAKVYPILKEGSDAKKWVSSLMIDSWMPPYPLFDAEGLNRIPEKIFSGTLPMDFFRTPTSGVLEELYVPEAMELESGKTVEYVLFSNSPLAAIIKYDKGVCLIADGLLFCHGEPPAVALPGIWLRRPSHSGGVRTAARRILGLVEERVPDEAVEKAARAIVYRIMRSAYLSPWGTPAEISAEILFPEKLLERVGLIDQFFERYAFTREDQKRLTEKIVEYLRKSEHPFIKETLSLLE